MKKKINYSNRWALFTGIGIGMIIWALLTTPY